MEKLLNNIIIKNWQSVDNYMSIIRTLDIDKDPDSINEMYSKTTEKLLSKVKIWKDLVKIYTMFIQGRLPGVPTYQRPLTGDVKKDPSTKLLSNFLIKNNVISVDSQPGQCNKYEIQRQYIELYLNLYDYNIAKLKDIINTFPVLYTIEIKNTNVDISKYKINKSFIFKPKKNDIVQKYYSKIDDTINYLPLTTYIMKNNKFEVDTRHRIPYEHNKYASEIFSCNFSKEPLLAKITFISPDFCKKSLLNTLIIIFKKYKKN